MGRATLLGLLAIVLATPGLAAPRVASIGVCADQYVLALAAPEQIVSLSRQATDPALSLLAEKARGYPRNRGSAEEILAAGAEVVVGEPWMDRSTMEILKRLGVRMATIGLTDDWEEIFRQTLAVARIMEREEEGKALVAEIAARRARLSALRPERAPLAVYLQPGGGSAGTGTFIDTLIRDAGMRNFATEIGLRGWGRVDLETLVEHPPEVLISSFFEHVGESLSTAYAHHPVFRRLAASVPAINVPGRDWVCSGWILIEAAERLARGPESER